MKTFLVKNRFGREVHVPENVALTFRGNPSMTIIGEVKVEVEAKEILVPAKNKPARMATRMVAKVVDVIKESIPGMEADIEYKGNLVKQKTVVTKAGTEVKKSSVLND